MNAINPVSNSNLIATSNRALKKAMSVRVNRVNPVNLVHLNAIKTRTASPGQLVSFYV